MRCAVSELVAKFTAIWTREAESAVENVKVRLSEGTVGQRDMKEICEGQQ